MWGDVRRGPLSPCCARFVLPDLHMDLTVPLNLLVPLESIELQGAFLLESNSRKGEEELYWVVEKKNTNQQPHKLGLHVHVGSS